MSGYDDPRVVQHIMWGDVLPDIRHSICIECGEDVETPERCEDFICELCGEKDNE